ncbi:hypothetical protein A3A71_00010 [Candidatus Berkelbacteria bacterium RIFCSPLOWO2_01_FULL_50_28]|uniref:Amidohydrolase-related domain-containing protein n=1 Tax=Candidatus Berkelbacteria bacterium RIFCSPLOWO2_01_FULL_50_28 TaxID=1797471 RepID=A0A1F5EAJ5_9BACT|nr:MAG: hypothetical protein A2807_03285 [Candidatus Berkelbacteria bacterium RIFCSPHIGHO2_01_FULL_50_36]OGD62422.1 MAG: hypothetical protein A3F39_01820 [Candidatus Berkelbacteria bacterium RIFCSPHIGHO2_12_FULL_50_11]OGD64437.1 MAG: hypothetical protein A3A71_00010 [Candidatus Berkelbacteria bacterium RIFCSPLOWO2_01_FULL_50_28]
MSPARKVFLLVALPLTLIFAGVIVALLRQPTPDPKDPNINSSADSWEKRVANAFKPSECPLLPKPKLDASYYQGPLIDAHFHPPSLPDSALGSELEAPDDQTLLGVNITYDEIACTFRNDGTSGKVFAFFPVYPNIYKPALEVVKRAVDQYPDVFVPFIMPPDNDGSPTGYPTVNSDTLQKMLKVYPNLFKGYGEIGLYERQGGAKELPPDSARLLEIYPVAREHNLVVMFHLGEGQAASYEKILQANRDIKFIWHGDQLINCTECTQDLTVIDGILSRNPNVYYGIDELYGDVFLMQAEVGKKKFLEHFKDYDPLLKKDVETWKSFIERHPDQVLWDTDRGVLTWSMDIEVGRALTNYSRAFIAELDPDVQEKFAYKNAEKLLPSN